MAEAKTGDLASPASPESIIVPDSERVTCIGEVV